VSPRGRAPSACLCLIAPIALAGVLVFAAVVLCGSPTDPLESLRVQSFQENIPAPALSLNGLDGRPLRLGDLKGKVVFLNFWATWCVPCRQEMPAMEQLYRGYRGRGLVVVAVNYQESKEKVQGFLKELGLSFPAVLDRDGAAANIYGVRGIPVSFLLSRDGRILWKAIGSRDWDTSDARAYFKKVLQTTRP
jgi:thiol-disulfide isomerase/thioredoxin